MSDRIEWQNSDKDQALEVSPPEVFLRDDGPFEAPPEKIVEGPFYMEAEEVDANLAENSTQEDASSVKDAAWTVDRRDFMRMVGAGSLMATTACIRRPLEKALPYVNQPTDFTPGVATHYSSTCGECSSGCGVIVKTREGRPTKIEGHPTHALSLGGNCTIGQAALQGLYHIERRGAPLLKRGARFDEATWQETYEILGRRVAESKNIAIFTSDASGNRHNFFRDFLKRLGQPEKNLYTYDTNPLSGHISKAHDMAFGIKAVPRIDFAAAKYAVGFGSDFLDLGVSQVHHQKSFSQARTLKHDEKYPRLKFVQFESRLTLTGSKADERFAVPNGGELTALLSLMRSVLSQSLVKGSSQTITIARRMVEANAALIDEAYSLNKVPREVYDRLAKEIVSAPSIIVAGDSTTQEWSTDIQLAAIILNLLVGAYEQTLHLAKGWMTAGSDPQDLNRFLKDVDGFDLVFVIDTNPVFTVPSSFGFAEKLGKVKTLVSIQSFPNETEVLAHYKLPGHHWLESWGDEQGIAGIWSTRQPVVRPTKNSQQAEDILLWLAAQAGKSMPYADYRSYLKEKWKTQHQMHGGKDDFNTFYTKLLRQGWIGEYATRTVPAVKDVSPEVKLKKSTAGTLKLIAPLDPRLKAGEGSNKPVLQEVGERLANVAWDSYLAINPKTAQKLGLKRNDLVTVETSAGKTNIAIYPMPGTDGDTVVFLRGNGHDNRFGKIADGVGVDPLVLFGANVEAKTGQPLTGGIDVKLSNTGKIYRLAALQKSGDIGNRKDIIMRTSAVHAAENLGKTRDLDNVPDLFPDLPKADNRWAMAIDLAKCTGCSACMVACNQENNIAIGGRLEAMKGRAMHWIRMDRYFIGDLDAPQVSFQPMPCQHCNHAPCEAVCPVFATVHDSEGTNTQIYNRCIGTRYCANACPYKVRRFNWYTYKWNTIGELERDRNLRALNPDVTVRTRGVMEKCTFCVQRLKEAKWTAFKEKNSKIVTDDLVKTACQQVCPADAIAFGNLTDPQSKVGQWRKDDRAYLALGGNPDIGEYGLKTRPNVSYLRDITLHEPAENQHHSANVKVEEGEKA